MADTTQTFNLEHMPFFYAAFPQDIMQRSITAVVESLGSSFMVLPKGDGWIDYRLFDDAYELLKTRTELFTKLDTENIADIVREAPLALTVLRLIAGLSPSELAHLATKKTRSNIDENWARTFDKQSRLFARGEITKMSWTEIQRGRVGGMIQTAVDIIGHGPIHPEIDLIKNVSRLQKVDTQDGWKSVRQCAEVHIAYSMLLYERFLGRPFATHRDAVSSMVGDVMESAVEKQLQYYGVSNHKTGHAESIPGFDQAPDFTITNPSNPKVVIEAKIS